MDPLRIGFLVETLHGDPGRAHRKYGWKLKTTSRDFEIGQRESLVKRAGFKACDYHERSRLQPVGFAQGVAD
jgi:hypothetical protein